MSNNEYTEIVILGLKSDLEARVSRIEVERFIVQHPNFQNAFFIDVSAKTLHNTYYLLWFANLIMYSITEYQRME